MNMSWRAWSVPALILVLSTGCLKTRSDVRELQNQNEIKQQVQTMQKVRAQEELRNQETLNELRAISGRIEKLETDLERMRGEREGMQNNFAALTEELGLIGKRLTKLEEAPPPAPPPPSPAPPSSASREEAPDGFTQGEEYYNKKEWKKAVLAYERYREKNPKGKNYAEATYKIGVCFQELEQKDNAKLFYEEAIRQFPGSRIAKKAAYRLKTLKL